MLADWQASRANGSLLGLRSGAAQGVEIDAAKCQPLGKLKVSSVGCGVIAGPCKEFSGEEETKDAQANDADLYYRARVQRIVGGKPRPGREARPSLRR